MIMVVAGRSFLRIGRNKAENSESLISQSFCHGNQSRQIVCSQILGQLREFANQLRFLGVCIEKLLGRNTEVIANEKELREGRQGLAGGDALNIALAMAQIQAHFVFRNAFLCAQFRNPISYKPIIHNDPTFLPYIIHKLNR